MILQALLPGNWLAPLLTIVALIRSFCQRKESSMSDMAGSVPEHRQALGRARSHLPDRFPPGDAFMVVEGERLELHSQVLATQASVLRDVFATREEGGEQGPADLSLLFQGHSLPEVSLLLRWLYSPQLASLAAMEEERALLESVLMLAHKLGAQGLIHRLAQHWMDAAPRVGADDLLRSISLADSCTLPELRARSLALLSNKLKAAEPGGQQEAELCSQLAECGEEAVLGLLGSLLGGEQPPEVLEVVEQRNGGGAEGGRGSSTTFGFTWVLHAFSDRWGEIASPWVRLGGRDWRLSAYPQGLNAGAGTHFSVFLWCSMAGARAASQPPLPVLATLTILDQASSAPQHYTSQLVSATSCYSADDDHWGRSQFISLADLQRQDRRYILRDSVVMRLSIIQQLPPEGDPEGSSLASAPPAFDMQRPEQFYLPSFFTEPMLSDTSIVVDGVMLPLHSQVLMLRMGACLEAASGLSAMKAEDATVQELAGRALARCCSGHALADVASYLRLIYTPTLAQPPELQTIEPQLAVLLKLAHSTQTVWLLQELAAHIEGRHALAHPLTLWRWAAAATEAQQAGACSLSLRSLTHHLLALGPSWEAAVPRGQLATNLPLAARLLGGVLAACDPAHSIFCVRDSGLEGSVGGFVWVLHSFSRLSGEVCSPYVAVGGEEWRVEVYPKGDTQSGGEFLSVFLGRNNEKAASGSGEVRQLAAWVEVRVVDQAGLGAHVQRTQAKPDIYTGSSRSWGRSKFMPFQELKRPDRQYLRGDRLVLVTEIRAPA